MKSLHLLWFAIMAVFVVSCSTSPAGESAQTGNEQQEATASTTAKSFKVDAATSVIEWEGTKVIGGNHIGTISLASGELAVKGGNIEAGEFVLDMKSIKCTDEGMPEDKKADLVGHLSNEDFFEVEKFPTAKFSITKVEALATSEEGMTHAISGNLAMKDSTKNVTFKAKIDVSENGLTAESQAFTIDRTQWGITFHSPTVFDVKNRAISDEMGIKIKLAAK